MNALKPGWQRLVDEANRQNVESGETPTRPATEEQIVSLRRRASEHELAVNEDFLTFLRYANGIVHNGLTVPRAGLNPDPNTCKGLDDFVIYNDRTSFIEIGPVYGNSDDTYYVLYPDGKFRRLGAGDPGCVLSTHDTFFDMLTDALAMAVGGD